MWIKKGIIVDNSLKIVDNILKYVDNYVDNVDNFWGNMWNVDKSSNIGYWICGELHEKLYE